MEKKAFAPTPEQEAAMNLKKRTLLVSAAAGSGKTSVLTKRIIKSIINDSADLSKMLIVTFTRAAAAELKERISTALGEALAKNPDSTHLQEQLFRLGSAQISTIDSFFQKTVKEYAQDLGIPSTFRIADSSEMLPIKQELLDELIERFYRLYATADESETKLRQIRSNAFARALDHLLSNRSDGKLYDVLLGFYNRFSDNLDGIHALHEQAEQMRLAATGVFFDSPWGKELRLQATEILEGHVNRLRELRDHLKTNDHIREKYETAILSDLALCEPILDAVVAKDYSKAFSLANGITKDSYARLPSSKGIQQTDQSLSYKDRRDGFKAAMKSVTKLFPFDEDTVRSQLLETADAFEMLYRFFAEFEERLFEKKTERGAFEFNDIRAMLYNLLNDKDGNPTAYADELASRYDIVYIDEYQDVDMIQDRLFARVGAKSRFMVGDIKQSIYGFRGSDPTIFAGYRERMPLHTANGADTLQDLCVFMSSNFRCDEPVIQFTNSVCSFLFSACKKSVNYQKEDDLVFKRLMPEPLAEDHPLPVRVEVFEAPKKKGKKASAESEEENGASDAGASESGIGDEPLWIANEIVTLLKEGTLDDGSAIKPSDIAILLRTNTQAPRFIKALSALSIPFATKGQTDILHDPLLVATLNFLRAVDNPYRDLPLTEFLLSEFGGFSLEQISRIRSAHDRKCALYDALLLEAKHGGEHAACAEQIISEIKRWSEIAAVESADRFLRLLYLDPRFAPYANTPPLLLLYDQARLYQRTAFCGLYGFLDNVTKAIEKESLSAGGFEKEESAVQIVTMHGSKGLEYPVVFVAGLGTDFNKMDLAKALLYHRELGAATKLYNRQSGVTESTMLHAIVKSRIKLEQTEEEMRLLYVALTRAKERLYVSGTLGGSYDTAVKNATALFHGDRHAILGISSPIHWILAVTERMDSSLSCRQAVHAYGDVQAVEPLPIKPREQAAEAEPSSAPTRPYREIAERQRTLVYRDELLTTLPSKLAASKLSPDILDTFDLDALGEDKIDEQLSLIKKEPRFAELLGDTRRSSAADVGTAMHTFLEFCNFKALKESGADAECDRLIANGFFTEDTRALLSHEQLEKLRSSDLMQMVLDAKEVKREQKFRILLPMSDFTESEERKQRLAGEQILVQGSIDLLLTANDGRLILVDYKTDHVTQKELENPSILQKRLQDAHENQLGCYARAVECLLGRAPDEVYIYSVPLGATVRINVSV